MKALLVDDERLARVRLRKLLEAHPEVTVVAEADSVSAARSALDRTAPEVVFLDIALPGESGFDLLTHTKVGAAVVFVTAYDEHAVRAFEVGAADYLLKPVEPARLAEAIRRIQARTEPPADHLVVGRRGSMRVVPIDSVLLARGAGDRSELELRDGTVIPRGETLLHWEERLGPGFFRASRTVVVSIAEVDRIERADGSNYRLFLRGRPEAIVLSRARAGELKARLRDRL